MTESTQTSSSSQAQLLFLKARLDTWCEQFEEARPSMKPKDAQKTEKRLLAMRQRLDALLVEKGLYGEPEEKVPAMEHLEDLELEQVAETLEQTVGQYEKLKSELLAYHRLVSKEFALGRPASLKKANDELRTKLEAHQKHEAQFRPIEDLVSSAGRQIAGHRDPLHAFLRITTRLKDMSELNRSIQSQYSIKESMSQWLDSKRRHLGAMAFQTPPSEQSLDESANQLSKVATLNQSLSRLSRARRYVESFLSRYGMEASS